MSELETKIGSRGLGRGLSALLGDAAVEKSQVQNGILVETPTDLIIPNPNQPRRQFDKSDLEALAETIRVHGVVQPIIVRAYNEKPGYYSIIAGERRWRASQLAGLHQIPTVIREFNDLDTLKIAIIENLQRSNLNAIEEAMAFEQLLDRFGYNQQTIADAIGRSRAYVANTLRLLGLPKEVQEFVIKGELSAGHARAALGAENPILAAKEMLAKGLNVRDAEKLANNKKSNTSSVSRETKSDSDTEALESDISNLLGLDVKIRHDGAKGGSLTINYKTLEQLDEVCRRLSTPK